MSTTNRHIFLGAVAAIAIGFSGGIAVNAAAGQAPRFLTPSASLDGEISFADIVEKVSPSVVSIHTEQTISSGRNSEGMPEELQEFLERQFGGRGRQFEFEGAPRERVQQAQGSGFFINSKGYLVTNNHVIEDAEEITIRMSDGREFKATLVGTDPATDLAVLKVDAGRAVPFVRFAEDVNLRVGDFVVAVGNPFGLGGTVTSGIVSAMGRDNNYFGSPYQNFIQIDASINKGNSGGPTFDLKGNVVGVNTAIFSPSGGSVGIGFAIPADTAKNVVAQLIDNGSVTRGWLGVEIRDVDATIAIALELKIAKGALVSSVQPGSPAAKAGIEDGDVITAFNKTPVRSSAELTRVVGNVRPGINTATKLIRDGKERLIMVKLGDRSVGLKEDKTKPSRLENSSTGLGPDLKLGIRIAPLSAEAREKFRVPEDVDGVLITKVDRGSAAEDAGLVPGMVIIKAEDAKIAAPADLEKQVKAARSRKKEALLLRVQIGDRRDFRALPLQEG